MDLLHDDYEAPSQWRRRESEYCTRCGGDRVRGDDGKLATSCGTCAAMDRAYTRARFGRWPDDA